MAGLKGFRLSYKRRTWTDHEEGTLRAQYGALSCRVIGISLNRTTQAVMQKAVKLKLPNNRGGIVKRAQIVNGTKRCSVCKKWVALEQFPKDDQHHTGRRGWCYLCSRAKSRQRWHNGARWKYVLFTQEEYDLKLEEQDGHCAICDSATRASTGRFRDNLLVGDHNHTTGQKRGLLCDRHNTSIGKFNESPEELRKAAEYLERYDVQQEKFMG